MANAPYNYRTGQRLSTYAPGVDVDRAFLAHFQVPAADAVALSANGVMAATNLAGTVQAKTTGLTSPAVPRALSIVGNVSGITGNVVVEGTNYANEVISETIALNGTSTVNGAKAFKTVTEVNLPVQTHTPTAQVETIAVTAGASANGTLVVRVTAVGMTGTPKDVACAVTTDDDTVGEVATKVRAALTADTAVAAYFTVGGSGANVVLTRKVPAANDATMAIALQNADSSGVTFGSSTDTTAGVPYDTVAVGFNDKLGIPYTLAHNTVLTAYHNNVLEATAATVTVSTTALESNTVDLNTALDGNVVDVYIMV